MAQSSSYKQYTRSTRVLTEESGFAGGMLWTGNNIDETHLKAIVNCDYDDTTGYLKTRDPFASISNGPVSVEEQGVSINLKDYSLLGTYNICAVDKEHDDELLGAGCLYVFAKIYNDSGTYSVIVDDDNFKCIYNVDGKYYSCSLHSDVVIATLHNVNKTNLLFNYENQLYGLGSSNPGQWLHVYQLEYSAGQYSFVTLSYTEHIKPKIDSIGLLEASVSGFNAARGEQTFIYGSKLIGEDEQEYILGVYLTDANNKVIVSPSVGQDVKIHVPVAYTPNTGKTNSLALFQLKESGDTTTTTLEESWTHCSTANIETDGAEAKVFVFNFRIPKKKTTLGFTYYGSAELDNTKPIPAYSDNAVDYLMPYTIVANDNISNLKVKNYDLTNTDSCCIWKNKLCVWSTQSNSNSLFLSDVDNFYYYPVPHNVALFDTNVISCIPYKDTLLVFTANKIWRVSENNDGSFSQTVIQNDMPLSRSDAAHLIAIKNMVLFKSGNYFYMIVPKSQSLTDELSVAPIYKNIAGLLNTLDKSTQEVLQLLYPEYLFRQCIVTNNVPDAVYAEQDTVHILYDIVAFVDIKESDTVARHTRSFKLFLNYNTNLRAWTLYFEDTSTASLEISVLTSSRIMSFVRILNNGTFDVVTQQPVVVDDSNFRILIDTGYRTLSASTQKRFREVQLKLYNTAETVTRFGTAFLVDGVWRRNYTKFQEVLLDNNLISLVPTLDLNTFVTELTMPVDEAGEIIKNPGSDAIELSDWTLDFSHFKREAPITIRVPVSGKGFNPRFIFMTPNASGLTINEINWVYRLMHGR